MNLRYERNHPQNSCFSSETHIIWHPDEVVTYYDRPRNSHCLFRKKFLLDKHVKSAEISIFGDNRYILYVNGKRCGRGPCRSDPRWKYYDVIDITKLLVCGENVISAEVLYYGYGTGHSLDRIPAFFAEAVLIHDDDSKTVISTDKSWKVCRYELLNRNSPRINGCKGCIEVFDMNKEIEFASCSFDDSLWKQAACREARYSPFWNLYRCPVDMVSEEYKGFEALIARGKGCAFANADVSRMHIDVKKELDSLCGVAVCEDKIKASFSPVSKEEFNYCIIKSERIIAGYISLNVTGTSGDIIDVVFSEELIDGKPVFNNISYRPFARFILKNGENKLEAKFNYEAFRYAYVIIRNHSGEAVLNNAGVIARVYPKKEESEFVTANPMLQKIWDISVHTLKLCMQDGFLDSPSREQQQWMGDGRFQAIMNYYVTGDCRMHEKLLLQIAQSQDFEGMTASRYPDANHNYPPIPSFCLQWINSFGDYYGFTGKTELISALWNNIILAMRWFSGFENHDGLLENIPYWPYYDMSMDDGGKRVNFGSGGINGLINMMYAEAMSTVIDLAKALEDSETASFFSEKLLRLKDSIKIHLWSEEAQAYINRISDGKQVNEISEAVNVMALLTLHDADDSRTALIVKNVFDRKTRISGVYNVSPYFMLPYYRALKKCGRNDIAFAETLKRYANMTESGATATWEDWMLTEKTEGGIFAYSACHAWAAAPIVLVAENLLGFDEGRFNEKTASYIKENFQAKLVTPNGIYNISKKDDRY